MKVLKILGILILLLVVGVAVWLVTLPGTYSVERTALIEAPASYAYDQVADFRNWDSWSPWEKKDPNMSRSYEGPEQGVGAIYKWSGNDSVGTGSLEVVEAVPNERIEMKLRFEKPFESRSDNTMLFEDEDGYTRVTWIDSGSLPFYLRMLGPEMDGMMGPDFEKGLADLKQYSERTYMADLQSQVDIQEEVEREGQ